MAYTIGWRIRIRDQSTLANPDGTVDAIVASTVPGVGQPVMTVAPDGDGASIDPLGGRPVTAVYRVTVADAVPNAEPPGVIRRGSAGLVTAMLGDLQGRQQMLSRRAFVEQTSDGGATWLVLCAGFVNRIRLVTAATYEITVGETLRIATSTTVFATTVPGLDRVSCLVGGPIADGRAMQGVGAGSGIRTGGVPWGPVKGFGSIRCRVVAADTAAQVMKVALVAGYWRADGYPWWVSLTNAITPYGFTVANSNIFSLLSYVQKAPGTQSTVFGNIGQPMVGTVSLTVLLAKTGDVVAVAPYPQFRDYAATKGPDFTNTPVLINPPDKSILVDWHDFYQRDANGNPTAPLTGIGLRTDAAGDILPNVAVPMPAVGDTVWIQAQAVDVSSDNPLHIQMHPMDLLTTLCTNARVEYDAASAAACRAAIGNDVQLLLRITQGMVLEDAAEQLVYGPFGVAPRINTAGQLQWVMCRQIPTTLPTVIWTDADIVDQGTASEAPWDLDEATITNRITVTGKRFFGWSPQVSGSRTLDEVIEADQSRTVVSTDFAAFGAQEQDYTFPGTVVNGSWLDGDLSWFAATIGPPLFERFGRGAITRTVFILQSSPQVNVGDLVIIDDSRVPTSVVP